MKITIEPEDGDTLEKKVYEGVYEFALVGSMLVKGLLPKPFSQSHGDIFVVIGKLEELKERLRKYNDGNAYN